MKTLFDSHDRETLRNRITTLTPESVRLWGRMNSAQMLCHCAIALETATGDRPMKQAFLGRLLTPFIRSSVLGEKPFARNAPTDPAFRVSDPRTFVVERDRLNALIEKLVKNGPEAAGRQTHAFFGALTGEEWGVLMHKHIDHHLQQFGC